MTPLTADWQARALAAEARVVALTAERKQGLGGDLVSGLRRAAEGFYGDEPHESYEVLLCRAAAEIERLKEQINADLEYALTWARDGGFNSGTVLAIRQRLEACGWLAAVSIQSDESARLLSLEEALRGLCENAEPIASHYGPHSHKWVVGLVVVGCPFCDLLQAVTAARATLAAFVGDKT